MIVIVDTSVWSEFFRRASPQPHIQEELSMLVGKGEAVLIGPVRQEILSGVRNVDQFKSLSGALRAFPDIPIETEDYEQAAAMFAKCRTQGIQGSNTDFLICSVANKLNAPIFTLDKDFDLYQKVLSIQLHRL